jgi:hypothetical protein
MIEDREIWACANQFIMQHGSDAWFAAANRADELLAAGEMEGHRTFMRILDRIKHLETMSIPGLTH